MLSADRRTSFCLAIETIVVIVTLTLARRLAHTLDSTRKLVLVTIAKLLSADRPVYPIITQTLRHVRVNLYLTATVLALLALRLFTLLACAFVRNHRQHLCAKLDVAFFVATCIYVLGLLGIGLADITTLWIWFGVKTSFDRAFVAMIVLAIITAFMTGVLAALERRGQAMVTQSDGEQHTHVFSVNKDLPAVPAEHTV